MTESDQPAALRQPVLMLRMVGIAFVVVGIGLLILAHDIVRYLGLAFVAIGIADNTVVPAVVRRTMRG